MKFKLCVLRIVAGIAILALMAGCTTATPTAVSNNPPTQAPTIDQAATLSVLGTQVAQTYVANQTLNAPTAVPPSATPVPVTNTPLPPTPTPAATGVPTSTPAPLPTSTNTPLPTLAFVFPTATPQFSPTPKPYSCTVLSVSPKPTDSIKVGAEFTGTWVVINTGTEAWPQAQTDVNYVSGEKFQLNGDIVDLQTDVPSGHYYTVDINMKATKYTGPYFATWAIVDGGQTACTLNITVSVVK